jgi:hypothetical protein
LTIGTSFDVSTGYYHASSIKKFNMDFNKGDTHTGVTVLNITDLSNVCYCCVDYYGMSNNPVQLMTPLNAAQYLWAFTDKGDPKYRKHSKMDEAIRRLQRNRSLLLKQCMARDNWLDSAGMKARQKVTSPIFLLSLRCSLKCRFIHERLAR